MKTIALILWVSLSLPLYGWAATQATVRVQATVNAGSCVPTLNPSTIDFGSISSRTLNTDQITALDPKKTTLTITCDDPMSVGFYFLNNRTDSVDANHDGVTDSGSTGLFGLGRTSKNIPLGFFEITIENGISVDGQSGSFLRKQSESWIADTSVGSSTMGGDSASNAFSVGLQSSAIAVPVPFSIATIPLSVKPFLNSRKILSLNESAKLDGSVTITITYI
ncbi:DUF1120 domain-containing protein [Citrobacter arsenatis]|uniref:DUF1120 domain-containing protein n=1 Tax=Citrobacter arsenatis TaxID=2546350 RepID=UPI00300E46F3